MQSPDPITDAPTGVSVEQSPLRWRAPESARTLLPDAHVHEVARPLPVHIRERMLAQCAGDAPGNIRRLYRQPLGQRADTCGDAGRV